MADLPGLVKESWLLDKEGNVACVVRAPDPCLRLNKKRERLLAKSLLLLPGDDDFERQDTLCS